MKSLCRQTKQAQNKNLWFGVGVSGVITTLFFKQFPSLGHEKRYGEAGQLEDTGDGSNRARSPSLKIPFKRRPPKSGRTHGGGSVRGTEKLRIG